MFTTLSPVRFNEKLEITAKQIKDAQVAYRRFLRASKRYLDTSMQSAEFNAVGQELADAEGAWNKAHRNCLG